MTSPRVSSSRPDFRHGSTILALLLLLLTLPIYLICFCLLLRKRRMYPIAGRGSTFILAVSVITILINLSSGLVGLFYSSGIPCTLVFLIDYLLAIPTSVVYILRGWVLVFRIEIKNYMEERRWRQEKEEAWKRGIEGGATAAAVVPSVSPSPHALTRIGVLPVLVSINESLEERRDSPTAPTTATSPSGADSTIPGFWFITHRRYISFPYRLRFITLSFVLFLTILIYLLFIHDPDLMLSERYLRDRGVIGKEESLTDESIFGPLTFFNHPECPPSSIKILTLGAFLMFLVLPTILWCSWRIWLDSRRRRKRIQEKLAYTGVQMTSGIPSPSSSSSTTAALDLDDTPAVKSELFRFVVASAVCILLTIPAKSFARTYIWMMWYVVLIAYLWISILDPLRISFALSKKLRERRHGSDVPPHRQVYYQLDYVLSNPAAYSALLTFLQKEHSSENILFLSAAQKFTTAARQLEHAAQWSSELPLYDIENSDGSTRVHSVGIHAIAHVQTQLHLDSKNRLPPLLLPSLNIKRPALIEIPDDPAELTRATLPIIVPSSSHPVPTTLTPTQQLLLQSQRLRALSLQIQHQYFDVSAMYEINLGQRASTLIVARNRQLAEEWNLTEENFAPPPFPLSTLYREVYTEVYRLIECDSFRRFVLTPAFESLLTKADELEANHLEHQPDLVAETALVVEHATATLESEIRSSLERPLLDVPHERMRSSSASAFESADLSNMGSPIMRATSPISRRSADGMSVSMFPYEVDKQGT